MTEEYSRPKSIGQIFREAWVELLMILMIVGSGLLAWYFNGVGTICK